MVRTILLKLVVVGEGIILPDDELFLKTISQKWIAVQQVIEGLGSIRQMCIRDGERAEILLPC